MDRKIKVLNKFTGYGFFNFFKEINDGNLDKYYNYLCDLIMEADTLKINFNLDIDLKIPNSNFNVTFYNDSQETNACKVKLYDINDIDYKEKLFKSIKICLTDEKDDIISTNIKKEYILEDISLKGNWIELIKDNCLFASFSLYGGYINDRREWKKIKNQKSILSGLRYSPKQYEIKRYSNDSTDYRYSVLFSDISNATQDTNLLVDNYLGKDNGKLEKYLDTYISYIFDLIDYCDSFIVEEVDNMNDYFYYKKYLKCEYFDGIVYKTDKSQLFSRRIFNIKSKKDKDILKYNTF